MKTKSHSFSSTERGAALILTAIVVVSIAAMSVGLLSINLETASQRARVGADLQSFYAAEAGLNDALQLLSSDTFELPEGGDVQLGTFDAPLALAESSYWVTMTDLPTRDVSIVGNGVHNGTRTRLELVASEIPKGFFLYGAFGSDRLNLDSNAMIDSFDSTLGTYDVQSAMTGEHWVSDSVTIGSNNDIVMGSNTQVFGDAIAGPTGVVDDTAPNADVSGLIGNATEEVAMPPIDVPPIPVSGDLVTSGDTTITGDEHFDRVRVNGGDRLTIRGPARVVVNSFTLMGNSVLILDAAHGPVELFGQGDFELQSNGRVATFGDAAPDVTIWLSTNNTTKHPADRLELNSNADFMGAIYAPNGSVSLSSNFGIYGSIMCKDLDLSSNVQIHFDEALLYDRRGEPAEYEPKLFRKLGLAD